MFFGDHGIFFFWLQSLELPMNKMASRHITIPASSVCMNVSVQPELYSPSCHSLLTAFNMNYLINIYRRDNKCITSICIYFVLYFHFLGRGPGGGLFRQRKPCHPISCWLCTPILGSTTHLFH